ncbi:hypothetical protein [Mesorhizobium sp. M0013]|uniref:hypothetical protein n=1 Tax=Mesorhizobium sp. M0013 TaxID=2956841 RepID=UPI00333B78ED
MDDDFPTPPVSALRNAFKASVAELLLPEARWAEHAKAIVRELTDEAPVDCGMIEWIIRK